ncbi:adenosylcobinamide-GDP ribazoletransferase [Roseobacter sp.]|uniref:adenosylcobinamide-GDP ribazoletransferase n=1 Tax=Roseobacter sp. TaxID=1907202 RepID=UPI00385E6513
MKTDRLPFWLLDILVAGLLLSRLPLPRLPQAAFANPARAVWAYPLIGAILGSIAVSCALLLTALGLPTAFAAGVLLAALMLTTGGMHEDGLADTADGFWGGFDQKRRLEVMKDSHLGTYGLLALIIVTGLRWSAYATLLPLGLLPIVAVAALSRSAMPCLMIALPHARQTGLSHSVGRPGERPTILGLGTAFTLAAACVGAPALLGLLAALLIAACIGVLSHIKIKGQTGDVLGATQQISELGILACFIVVLT